MNIRTFALGGAAAVAMTSLLGIAPAFAFTHHPATPEEIRQTDQLNAQSLANAQATGGAAVSNTNGMQTSAPAQPTPAPDKSDTNTPSNGQ
ncbi:MAG TPA: hypothetical protein VJ476_04930 [Rhizomicrobium sp.]|nr:hypothetical protein [Rhizomicrobium sp.]